MFDTSDSTYGKYNGRLEDIEKELFKYYWYFLSHNDFSNHHYCKLYEYISTFNDKTNKDIKLHLSFQKDKGPRENYDYYLDNNMYYFLIRATRKNETEFVYRCTNEDKRHITIFEEDDP